MGGLEPWVKDIYGCQGNLLAKRRKRNPYRRFHPYHTSGTSLFGPRFCEALADPSAPTSTAPELEGLLEYCPRDNELFEGRLPWDS